MVFADDSFNQLATMTLESYDNQKVAEGLFIYNTDGSPVSDNYVGGFNLGTAWTIVSSDADISNKNAAIAARFFQLTADTGIGAPKPAMTEGNDIIHGTLLARFL